MNVLRSACFFTVIIVVAIALIPWVIFVDLPRYVLNGPSGPDPDWLKHQ